MARFFLVWQTIVHRRSPGNVCLAFLSFTLTEVCQFCHPLAGRSLSLSFVGETKPDSVRLGLDLLLLYSLCLHSLPPSSRLPNVIFMFFSIWPTLTHSYTQSTHTHTHTLDSTLHPFLIKTTVDIFILSLFFCGSIGPIAAVHQHHHPNVPNCTMFQV